MSFPCKTWIRTPRNPHFQTHPQHFAFDRIRTGKVQELSDGTLAVTVEVAFRHVVKRAFVAPEYYLFTCCDQAELNRLLSALKDASLFEDLSSTSGISSGLLALSSKTTLDVVELDLHKPSQTPTGNMQQARDHAVRIAVERFIAQRFCEKEPLTLTLLRLGLLKLEDVIGYIDYFIHSEDSSELSLIVMHDEQVIGAALNETLQAHMDESDAVPLGMVPVVNFLVAQDEAAVSHCDSFFEGFRAARSRGKVGHHMMVAGNSIADAEAAFYFSMVTFKQKGYEFVVVEATNPWTVGECAKYGAVPVHSAAFRDFIVQVDDETMAPIGPLDQASVFFTLRLA